MSDDYSDLPSWIRPGAKLACLGGGYIMITVQKITRTQIVAVADGHPQAVYRFDRTPRQSSWYLRGDHFRTLERRDHPVVIRMHVDKIARNVAAEVATLRRAYDTPDRSDRRSGEERALDLIDGIENAARTARRKVDALLDPSALASAQYAQDLEV